MAWPFDIIASLLARTPAHQADHGADDLVDAMERVVIRPKALAFDNGGWLSSPSGEVKILNFPSARTTKLVPFEFAPAEPGPDMVVWHWTATGDKTIDGCARRVTAAPRADERAAGFHLGIGRDGHLAQSVPATKGSWHAGGATAARFHRMKAKTRSSWGTTTTHVDHGYSANQVSYGIELECVGEVRNVEGKWRGWPFHDEHMNPTGPIVPAAETVPHGTAAKVKYYQCFTKAQQETAAHLVRALVAAYPWLTIDALAWTHARIDPTRKTDPGPLWSEIVLPRILRDVMGGV